MNYRDLQDSRIFKKESHHLKFSSNFFYFFRMLKNDFVEERQIEVHIIVCLHDKVRKGTGPVNVQDVLEGVKGLQRVVVGVLDVVDL